MSLDTTLDALHLLTNIGVETEVINITSPITTFKINKTPGNTPLTILANGQIYSEITDDFEVDRANRIITWKRTAANGGIDLAPPLNKIIVYYALTEDQGLSSVLTTISGYSKNITAEASLIQDMRQVMATHSVQLRTAMSQLLSVRETLSKAVGLNAWAYDKYGNLHPRLFNSDEDNTIVSGLELSGVFTLDSNEDLMLKSKPESDTVYEVLSNGDIRLKSEPLENFLWRIDDDGIHPRTNSERVGYTDTTGDTGITGGSNIGGVPDGAGSHNTTWRNDDITDMLINGTLSVVINSGTFINVFPGDYITWPITVDGVLYPNTKWIVMGCNCFLDQGDIPITENHIILMPDICLGAATPGKDAKSYTTSDLWNVAIPALSAAIISAFGSAHVISHREYLDGQWTSVTANLPTGIMMCGAAAAPLEMNSKNQGTMQLPVCAAMQSTSFIQGQSTWTRTATATGLMVVDNRIEVSGAGFVAIDGQTASPVRLSATSYAGLRPYFLFK